MLARTHHLRRLGALFIMLSGCSDASSDGAEAGTNDESPGQSGEDTGGTDSGTAPGAGDTSATSTESNGANPGGSGTGSGAGDTATGDTATGTSDGGSGDAPGDGHAIHLDVVLSANDESNVRFLTAAASVVDVAAADIVGKPYFLAVFDGGFEQGVDLGLFSQWGVMPEDLHVEYSTPAELQDGPYDLAFMVYTETEITPEIKDAAFPPAPAGGELSAFTISQDEVRPGDPTFENGVVRVNVEGEDATLTLENRHDTDDLQASFTNTILVVP